MFFISALQKSGLQMNNHFLNGLINKNKSQLHISLEKKQLQSHIQV